MSATNPASRTVLLVVSLLPFTIVGCRTDAESKVPPRVAASDPAVIGESNVARDDARDDEPVAASPKKPSGLVFHAQPGWRTETTSSPMRKAEFTLPRAGGDGEDASLVVYYFGAGQGGGREANLERWASQFDQPDGSASIDRLESSSRKVAGLDVHDVALSGTYVAETSPGSGVRVRKQGWRMLASILESDHGPYYAKLVGPAATVTHWEPAYRRFVSEVRPGG